MYQQTGRYADAEKAYLRALRIYEATHGVDGHPHCRVIKDKLQRGQLARSGKVAHRCGCAAPRRFAAGTLATLTVYITEQDTFLVLSHPHFGPFHLVRFLSGMILA